MYNTSRLNNVPDIPVIYNYGYCTKNISVTLDFHVEPMEQAVKSYIKGTNNFWNKPLSIPKLPGNKFYAR